MKETLKIKNFGPIIDTEIEIKDINIFIGTTSSGKSTVAKLIAIFKSGLLIYNPEWKDSRDRNNYLIQFNRLLVNYNIEYKIDKNTYIKYQCGELYYEVKQSFIGTTFTPSNKVGVLNPIYIPAERTFFPTFSQSIFNFLTNDIALPRWLIDFGAKFEKAKTELSRFRIDFLKADYVFTNGNDFVELDNGGVIKLSQASSGMQSIIPLMLVVQHNTNAEKQGDDLFIIEEPELNLYPSSQKDLTEFIVERVNQSGDKLIITTHSPYLLTSIDNLIQAGNVSKSNPQSSKKIEKLVPSSLWIDFDSVSCYFFNDGGAKSTLDLEIHSIGPSNIDDVSTELSETFENLLTLKYPE